MKTLSFLVLVVCSGIVFANEKEQAITDCISELSVAEGRYQ